MAEAVPKTADVARASGDDVVGKTKSRRAESRERSDSDGPPEGPDPLIGTLIAEKFEILDLLGKGAMGRIYRAQHLALDRTVAIKVLHEHLGGEDRVAKRFHREAKAASRLSHPNSVQIIDFGRTTDGLLYIAMELLEGEDLQTILDHDHPLAPARIAHIIVPALRAVEEAHRAGVIHRDFKPDNIIIWEDRGGREHVKVCDFGIAKVLDAREGSSITVDGFVCGTPQYMAPEQARGDEIDHRVDVYAAGVVLYQMLVGKVPFGGDSALGIITKHLTETALPPHERVPDLGVPRVLEEIAVRGMSKDPALRYQTAGEMADAIEAATKALGSDASSKLGEGTFTLARTKREWRSGDTTSKTALVPTSMPPSVGGARVVAIGASVIAMLMVGLAWWMGSGATVPPSTVPLVTVAPPTTATVDRVPEPPPTVVVRTTPEVPPPTTTTTHPADLLPEPPATVAPPTTRVRTPRASSVEPPPTTAIDARSDGRRAFDEGRRLFLANEVPGAIAQFETAARLMPNDADVQKQLGRAYMRAGDVPHSVAAYRRYLALSPDAADRAIIEGIIAQH